MLLVLEVFWFIAAVDEDVVEVHQDALVEEGSQDLVHQPHEGGRRVSQSERQHPELIVAISGPECGLGDILVLDQNLVVSRAEIDLGEHPGVGQPVE